MSRSGSYNTKQKELILNTIMIQQTEFTIKDLYEKLKNEVGLTTIYRLVQKLIDEKLLNKYISKDNITYYQILKVCDKENHFYLKCNYCGSLVHVDCDCIKDLLSHILKQHKFKPNKEGIIINGICDKCISVEGV